MAKQPSTQQSSTNPSAKSSALQPDNQLLAKQPSAQQPNNQPSRQHLLPLRKPYTSASPNITLSGAAKSTVTGNAPPAYHIRYPRWAAQAGMLLNTDSGYGARLSILYRQPLNRRFFLQPYIGIGYTGGYKKAFSHTYVQITPIDSGHNNRLDTITTLLTAKNALAADIGLHIGYQVKKLSLTTGLRYSRILQSGGSSSVSHDTIRMVTPPATNRYNKPFSKRSLPGSYNLSWNIDAAWQWRPWLQTGIGYRLVLHQQPVEDAWKNYSPPGNSSTGTAGEPGTPGTQDKSRIEIFIRVPFGRK